VGEIGNIDARAAKSGGNNKLMFSHAFCGRISIADFGKFNARSASYPGYQLLPFYQMDLGSAENNAVETLPCR
jgi:hypothetical protein